VIVKIEIGDGKDVDVGTGVDVGDVITVFTCAANVNATAV
jgi:hypothetical protein